MYAATALERCGHQPGVRIRSNVLGRESDEAIQWQPRFPGHDRLLDWKRVTEDGAECIALLIVGTYCKWNVVRRLQSRLRERADWLVEIASSGEQIVLEVSGTDRGPFEPIIRQKMGQAGASPIKTSHSAACVVRFREPMAELRSDHDFGT